MRGRRDAELEKALGLRANEDIEKELQTASKSYKNELLMGSSCPIYIVDRMR